MASAPQINIGIAQKQREEIAERIRALGGVAPYGGSTLP